MPHAYALHVAVTAPCLCCRAPREFVFSSPSDQVVCAACVNHLGSDKAERRDLEHVTMWERLHADLLFNHQGEVESLRSAARADAEEIARLGAQVVRLTSVAAGEFSADDVGGVRGLIENDVTRRAERNTELANRRIDRIMAVLWRFDRLHHENDNKSGLCTCGKPLAKCPEYLALEPERQGLRDWERKNLALARDNKRHGLPPEHPELEKDPPRR